MLLNGSSMLTRILQGSLALYLSFAVLYTTSYLLDELFPTRYSLAALFNIDRHSFPFWYRVGEERQTSPARSNETFGQPQIHSDQQVVYWKQNSHVSAGLTLNTEPIPMTETLFLSKAFAHSMHPSKTVPFYYRATGEFSPEDITITTLVTGNRFAVLAELVRRYQGPISVTVHVPTAHSSSKSTKVLLEELHSLYTSSPLMSTYVDVHLVHDAFDRQFNTWRNLARLLARTDYVMMLDVDFAICTDFRTRILRDAGQVKELLRGGNSALIVPAFEYTKSVDGKDASRFPTDKAGLLKLVKKEKIGMFHRSWAPGHNSTDYRRYYSAKPGEVYKVTQYQSAYEPYVIFKKDGPPWCDERFVGYGGNKAACLFEMYLSGMSFYVLSDDFIIHQSHLYEEEARKQERKYNRRIYSDFREETCFRYLKLFHADGTLNTSRGYNVQDECKKIKGVSRLAAEILDT